MRRILIVSANYYKKIADKMLDNSVRLLKKKKFKYDIIEVPGVFEIPVTIAKKIKKYDAIVALGCVIKGETPHFDFISDATTHAIMNLSVNNKKPIGNGVITCLNIRQAKARYKKGTDAVKAIISVLTQ